MFGTLGGPELFLIFVVALIVFGPRKLPDIGKSLGKMMSEFRRASNDFRSTIESEVESEKIRDSMRIEPPKVKKVDGSGASPSSGAGDSEGEDPLEDADAEGPKAASAADGEGSDASSPDAESGAEGSGGPDEPSPDSGADAEGPSAPGEPAESGTEAGVPSTVSRQPPPPAIEPK